MVSRNAPRHVAVLASAVLFAACNDATPTAPAARAPQLARSPQAQERLEAIFQRVSPDVMALPGTVFADNDEVAGKVVIGVARGAGAHGLVRATMARLGVAEGDYAVEETAPIVPAKTLRDTFRPTVAGIQLHFTSYVCTLGFNVDHAGGRSFITNSHCTATQGGTEGTTYAQPSRTVDGTVIATEVDDPPYVKNGAGCPKGKKCRWSDASRALYAPAVASNRGEIAMTNGVNNGSLTLLNDAAVFTITSQDAATTNFAGKTLNKVGRTTGWSQGPVTRTCVNSSVQGSQVYLFCQTIVTAAVGSGDSGSPVFEVTSGSSVKLVGILWGGASDNSYFVMSPLANVVRELGPVTATR